MAKRILRNLKLTHISAVDSPCQEGALAVLLKGDEPAEVQLHQTTDTFISKAQAISIRDGIPLYEAMSKARREYPATFADYLRHTGIGNQDGIVTRPTEPWGEFMAEARKIAARDSIALHDAMSLARRNSPNPATTQ